MDVNLTTDRIKIYTPDDRRVFLMYVLCWDIDFYPVRPDMLHTTAWLFNNFWYKIYI